MIPFQRLFSPAIMINKRDRYIQYTHTLVNTHTFILLPAVVGRPFFSALRFSGNRALMKALLEDKGEELGLTQEGWYHPYRNTN